MTKLKPKECQNIEYKSNWYDEYLKWIYGYANNVTSLSLVQLTDRQKKIYDLIKENPFISGEQMSVVLSVVLRTIRRDLSDMEKKGVLIREGNTSAGHWVCL